jgi:threonine dehydrogenase-like Zn-dependent dehydrogenase
MKAIAVKPGNKNSVHLRDVPKPKVTDIPDGRGVLVKVLKVALDGTDRDIDKGEYGNAPDGDDYLIIGHESFGIVEEVGPNVTELKKGDYVVATVRRPGKSFYDALGMQDMTADAIYFERGINLLHGYFTEYYVEKPDYLIVVPDEFKDLGVMTEPVSIVTKAYEHTIDIQRRMGIWRPKKVAVIGAGPLGMLAAWKFRLERLDTSVFSLEPKPNMKAGLLEELGAKYYTIQDLSHQSQPEQSGPFDIVFEASGYSPNLEHACHAVAKNGVVILSSVTPKAMQTDVNFSKINMDFVLGNKIMFGTVNASYHHFSLSVKDIGYGMQLYTGWMEKMITHTLDGLDQYERALYLLNNASKENALKIVIKVADE